MVTLVGPFVVTGDLNGLNGWQPRGRYESRRGVRPLSLRRRAPTVESLERRPATSCAKVLIKKRRATSRDGA
jgi:hypothetical protein